MMPVFEEIRRKEQDKALAKECEDHVNQAWKEAVTHGTLTDGPQLDPETMFQDVFKELTPSLARQRLQLAQELKERAQK